MTARSGVVLAGLLVSAAGVCAQPRTGSDACQLARGLYRSRESLQRQFDVLLGRGYGRTLAEKILAQLRPVDLQYARFFDAVSVSLESGDTAAIARCCSRAQNDSIGTSVCGFAAYLAGGRKDRELLLESFTKTEATRRLLWTVDEIAGGAFMPGQLDEPHIFPPGGPAFRYIDELLLLVGQGDRRAISAWFDLLKASDGLYAEYMDDRLTSFLRDHPRIVLDQWISFRQHRNELALAADPRLSDEETAATIRRNFKQLCPDQTKACEEILAAMEVEPH